MNTTTAVFPGTFDPITNGHIDLIKRAAGVFSKVIVSVAQNKSKEPLFSLDERVSLAREVLSDITNITVVGFKELLVDFAKSQGASVILRGLRVVSDFEYEFQLANMNRRLNSEVETIFLTPNEMNSFISSTLVKEVAMHGGAVDSFVPAIIAKAIKEKYHGTKNNR